jgi:predicted TIM-barrel fold metal-dependent hydrolase
MHVYDSRYPHVINPPYLPPDALVTHYRLVQHRLGLSRTIVVTPSAYGTDNRITLDGVRQLGASARAVAVVDDSIDPAELRELDGAGVRGVRFNLVQSGATTPEMLRPVARKIADLGWHVQIHALHDQLVYLEQVLSNLPVSIVLDHIARIPVGTPQTEPALARTLRLLGSGRAWVKLSAPYLESRLGSPLYEDLRDVVAALVREAPERLLWGSDWPHPSESAEPPDDLGLLRALRQWVPQQSNIRRILVDNPARLYRF